MILKHIVILGSYVVKYSFKKLGKIVWVGANVTVL